MKPLFILLLCLLLASCGKPPIGGDQVGMRYSNHVANVNVERVEKEGENYFKLTIKQRINAQAPAYIVDIRERKVINKFGYYVGGQNRDEDLVTTVFYLRPLVPVDSITFEKEDFLWHPRIEYFEPIKININESNKLE